MKQLLNDFYNSQWFLLTVIFLAIWIFVSVEPMYLYFAHGQEVNPTCSPPPKYKDNTIVIVDPTSNCVITYSNLGYEIKAIYEGMMYMQKVVK